MSAIDPQFILIPVTSNEVQVISDALVAFANIAEAEGDACAVGPICDAVAARLRALHELDAEWARQHVLMMGLGTKRARPQG